MVSISKTVQLKIQNPSEHFTPEESEMVLPYFVNKLLEQGKAEGIVQGKAEGIVQGKAEGIVQGKAEGIVQGKAEGIVQGKAEGIVQGKAEGMVQGILAMLSAYILKNPQMSNTQVATVFDVELSMVEQARQLTLS
jgi:flagellar biosynthesis/type III secretory pathway protein FliH